MEDYLWWRDGVIYQIYPRSFSDSTGNGLGDLPGITSRLDYLADLGIDAIWLSPFYPTPDADFGYDVSDHTAVDPRYGTLADFDYLLAEAHRRGIRVILDLVLNHTSDRHPWFLESRSSRTNPKRAWYLWRDQPNKWQSIFGGRAWTRDTTTGQYYYHMFLPEQPDVNWRNPEARKAQLDVVRFWLQRGVDGFRLDVFNVFFKHPEYLNNPARFGLRGFERQRHVYDCDRPEMIPLLNDLRALLNSYPERYAIGETFLATPQKAASYCGLDLLHAAFNFDFTHRCFNPRQLLDAIQVWEAALGGRSWPNYTLSNHDIPRSATRYANRENDARAKVMLALLLTLRGTPFIYYGEEIGMRDISLRRGEILDPPGKRYWPIYKGRDGCRSPMQWDSTPFAGFSSVRPWLPVHNNYHWRNVASQKADPDSILNFTRQLIALRKENQALRTGDFVPLAVGSKRVLLYLRRSTEKTILVALNFTGQRVSITIPQLPQINALRWKMLFSSALETDPYPTDCLRLAPYGVILIEGEKD